MLTLTGVFIHAVTSLFFKVRVCVCVYVCVCKCVLVCEVGVCMLVSDCLKSMEIGSCATVSLATLVVWDGSDFSF